jgi:sn-glycerol 3-phosphate transport system substrate-binding protein
MPAGISRRTILKGAAAGAATAAISKRSSFAAPAVIQSGPVEVVLWSALSGALQDAIQHVVDEFNASQTEIKVVNQFQGTYDEAAQKLTAAIPAKNAPDIAHLSEAWWFKFFIANSLQPLDDYIAADQLDTADYVDSLINEGNKLGHQWWMPWARSTPLFYYNKDVFTAAGLPNGPKTWDELAAAAPSMVTKDGDTITRSAFALASIGDAWGFQGMIWAWGGRYSDDDFNITINQEAGVSAGEFYKSMVADGWASLSTDAATDFTNGLTAASIMSTGGMKTILESATTFEVGTAFLPEGPAGFGCCTGGSGLSILAGSADEKKSAAWEFVKFTSTPENTTWWSQNTGYMPVRKSAVDSESMKTFYTERPTFKTAVEQLALTKPQDPARIYVPNGLQTLNGALEAITVELDDVQAAFDDAAATLTDDAQSVIESLNEMQQG